MVETSAWILRISIILLLLRTKLLECQHTTEHRKVPQAPEYQQGPATGDGGPTGSWGPWGPWMACSRSCGGGVQEQTRPCLPAQSTSAASSSRTAPFPLSPGHMVSPLRPSVPLHRDPAWPVHGNKTQRDGKRELRGKQRDPQTGHRGGGDKRVVPGRYGYGKMPYMVPLQTDAAWKQGTGKGRSRRQRQEPKPGQQSLGQHRGQLQSHSQYGPGQGYDSIHHRHQGSQPRTNPSRASLYTSGAGLDPQQELYPDSRPSVEQPSLGNPYSPPVCLGARRQHRMCNSNSCPPASRHIREVQCSSFNNHPFMGRLYEWEPFNEVQSGQHCELNCRAIGFRFYVRHSEKVIDGTPCGQNKSAVCVEGTCQSPGCDEYLGSGKMMDKCGVCGGDNSTCRLVSGVFKHSLTKVGYHKIVEIPEGATKINVTEMVKSRNYLALRSRSGRSIVNGQWAIDRPGKYEGAGTMFTYRRPNEISNTAGESLLAEGPTNEILDVYMIYQQPNPGVQYEFILPVENPVSPRFTPDSSPGGNTLNGQGGYVHRGSPSQEGHEHGNGARFPQVPNNQVPVHQPPRRQREHNWKLVGSTECSASCGRGSRYAVFRCVHRATHQQVADSLCDSTSRPSSQEEPCNMQPCPAFWDIGEWSECSKTCGLGQQHRQVLCRQVYANHTLNVQTNRCQHLERPETTSTCQLQICSEWHIRTDWTACSVPCGVGQRSREVRCVSNVGDFVAKEECNMKLQPNDVENCDMGPCAKSWFYTEWGSRCSAECGVGVRARSVLCLNNHISSLPLEGCGPERPADSQDCNNGPCDRQIEWFTGPWSQCSTECGSGHQQRQVVCLQRSEEVFTVLPPYECSSLERPPSEQSCLLKACGAKWYHTDWSACSKTCEGGFRVREVRCLSDNMLASEACEEQLRPEDRETCSPEPCVPPIDENCQDKYFNCNVVVQARLCVYPYYKTTCCASCTRVAQRQSEYRGRN